MLVSLRYNSYLWKHFIGRIVFNFFMIAYWSWLYNRKSTDFINENVIFFLAQKHITILTEILKLNREVSENSRYYQGFTVSKLVPQLLNDHLSLKKKNNNMDLIISSVSNATQTDLVLYELQKIEIRAKLKQGVFKQIKKSTYFTMTNCISYWLTLLKHHSQIWQQKALL